MGGDAKTVFIDTNVLIYSTFNHFAQRAVARTYIADALPYAALLSTTRVVLGDLYTAVTIYMPFIEPYHSTTGNKNSKYRFLG